MRLTKTLTALLLALALVLGLSACHKEDQPDGPSGSPTGSVSPSPSAQPEVDLLPDNAIDVTQTLYGFPEDTPMLTVNGQTVSAEAYLYWLGNMAAYYDSLFYQYYYQNLDFTMEVSEGKTWDDQIKEIAYQNSVLLAITPSIAQELNVSLTDAELQEVYDQRAEDLESTGRDAYADRLQALGINDRTDLELRRVSRLFQKIEDVYENDLLTGSGPDAITDQTVDEYVEQNDLLRAKHILILTKDMETGADLSEEEQAAAREKIDGLAAQLAASDDPAALFDTLMNENSQDSGLSTNPDGYLFTAGDMVSEFEEGTRALEFGGISPVIQSTYGYHIILRLDPDCAQTRQTIAQEKFNDLAQSYVDSAQVTLAPEYEDISAADYYQKLLAFQDTLEPEESASPTLEPYDGDASTPVPES